MKLLEYFRANGLQRALGNSLRERTKSRKDTSYGYEEIPILNVISDRVRQFQLFSAELNEAIATELAIVTNDSAFSTKYSGSSCAVEIFNLLDAYGCCVQFARCEHHYHRLG